MTKKSVIYEPQRRYSEKQRAAGLVPVTVWVPEAERDVTIEHAAKLRAKHNNE